VKNNVVLVIEDNALNMKLIRTVLQLQNYQIVEAVNAEQGLNLARTSQPDLILMDIQLPGIDGLTATRRIKADPDLKHIPVVGLSSYAMQGDKEQAIKAGCSGYITKPIDTRAFLKTLSEYLR
jgi:CheY-like chemotaxis protein